MLHIRLRFQQKHTNKKDQKYTFLVSHHKFLGMQYDSFRGIIAMYFPFKAWLIEANKCDRNIKEIQFNPIAVMFTINSHTKTS